MTPVARRVVWSLVAAVVILGAGVAALVTFWPRGPQGVPPQLRSRGMGPVPHESRARVSREPGKGGVPRLP